MMVRRRSLFTLVLAVLLVATTVRAQETPTSEPPTPTIVPTELPTLTPIPTDLPTLTPIPTEPPTLEPSFTPLPLPTETETETPTATETETAAPTATETATNTEVASATVSLTPSMTAMAAETATSSATASATASPTPSLTASATTDTEDFVSAQDVQALNVTCDPDANIQQANVSSSGEEGNVSGNLNSLSADGRYLYFPSRADNLVVDDTNNMVDYFEFDRTNCQTRRITVGTNGEQGDGDSDVGNISGNGQYFAFASKSSNFAVGDTNGKYDIFVKNLQTGAVTRIPADPDNLISTTYYIGDVTISDDGRYVAFDVLVTAATPSGFAGTPVVYDTQTSTRTVIASEGRNLYISGDGNYIAFVSSVTNLVVGDTNNVDDVFVYERATTNVSRVSVWTDGTQSTLAQEYPSISISSNGRYVAFTSLSSLAANDTNALSDVYVRDRTANTTRLASLQANGTPFANGAVGTRISPNGQYVVFLSDGLQVRDVMNNQTFQVTNSYPVTGGLDISTNGEYIAFSTQSGTSPNLIRNAYIADRTEFLSPTPTSTPSPTATRTATATATPATGFATCTPNANFSIVSVNSTGTLGNGDAGQWDMALSNNGRYVYYLSSATVLVSNDTNTADDIFRFDRETCLTTRISTAANGDQANNTSSKFGVSENGQILVFRSSATNLIAGDVNPGIFVRNFTNNTLIRIPNTSSTSDNPSISADGRYVAYTSPATSSSFLVMLYDTQTSQTVTATTTSTNIQWAKISGDGSVIVYNATDTSLGVYDRVSAQATPLNFNVNLASLADISANGRYIVFSSGATDLVPNDTNNSTDTFVFDRQSSQIVRVSVNSAGGQAASASGFSSISPDGRYVSFLYSANGLVASDTNNASDVYVRDLLLQRTYLVSTGVNGALGNNGALGAWLPFSADNQYFAFGSYASNLIANDLNNKTDIFVTKLSAFQVDDFATATAAAPMTATAGAPLTQVAIQTNAAATATYIAANTIVVNSLTNMANQCTVGSCTLPQALALSESLQGVQTITFNLSPVNGYQIRLDSALTITSSVIIDGTTQPGYAGIPLIELVPNSPTTPTEGIIVNGASPISYDPNTSVTIRGLVIGGFSGSGIVLGNGQGHLIEDNYIGTTAAGMAARGNGFGILMRSPNNIIRDNLISGNTLAGIFMNNNAGRNSTHNTVVGNYIGTDVTGTTFVRNKWGIHITEGASNNTIGGDTPEEANVISGNLKEGILLDNDTTNANTISGNIIGLDANGQYIVGNGDAGIRITNATNTVVGGTTFAAGNQIWGNVGGVVVSGQTGSTIRNNVIAQNGMVGISVAGNNTAILENVIAFHTNVGIQIGSGTGNRISMNRVYSNGGPGTVLGNTYTLLPNDAGDVDTGANELQNYPVISSVTNSITGSTITGSLSSKADATYRVEFFSNNQCDANGYGEGQAYIGYTDVTTNASGVANFTASLPSILENTTFGMGWSGVFYPSNNLTGTGVPVSGINGLNFNWGTGAPVINSATVAGIPSDHFSARFTSTQAFAAGNYTFNVSADDGVRVYIDGVLKLDKFVGRPLTTDQFTTALTAGNHTLTVEYFDSLNQASLQFNWYAYGTTAKVITSTATDASGNTSGFSACQVLQNVLGLGSYQETNVNFVYQGTWMSLIGAGNGGSFKYTNDANARLSFWVDSSVTRITFYRTTHPQYGSTQIYLDSNPTPFATMSNMSSSIIYGVGYTIVIPAGDHKIELRNVGTSYSTVDQIDLLPPAVALAASDTAYQETEANLTYVGNWVQNANASALGGSRRFTNDPNGRVSFNINNSVGRISIYRTTYQAGVYGSMQIFVDNVLVATMPNNPNPTLQFGVPFTFAVTPGSHTVELRNVGSTYSDIDQIKLMPAAAPLTTAPGIYYETEVELSYSGNWVQNANPNALSGARRFTNDPNARVSFKVNNSVERITIYRTVFQAGVYGTMQVYVDGVLSGIIANNTTTTFQYGVPYTFTVTPGDHTIELRNVGSTYSDLDQIKLEAAADPLTTTPGTYQETDVNITYTGNWVTAAARRYTNDPNGRVSFNIDESVGRVTIYRAVYQAGVYGSLQIYVDGVLNGTINNTGSTTLQLGQPYTFTVTPGDHTIELRNVGSTYSDLDQIKLEAPTAPLTTTAGTPPGTYQETDANLTYTGNWVTAAVRRYTNDPNGRVSFNIDESVGRITIYRAVYQAGVYGSLQIYVDGVLNGTINNTGSTTLQLNQPYTFTVTPGDHTIELRNGGSTYSDLDQIKLEAPTAPLTSTPGTYQETDVNLTYTGTWGQAANGLSGGRRFTNDPNGRVSFNIDASVERITIYRTVYQVGVYGSLQVYVDGAPNGIIANNTSTTFQFGVPYTFTVTPGDHRIELRNVGSTYSDIDQIVLEAPPPSPTATPHPVPTQGSGL